MPFSVIADDTFNAVNERLPVSKAEMEVHWRVNCREVWARLHEIRGQGTTHECVLPVDLQNQLTLCAFIYQPPGEELPYSGPDYQSAISVAKCYPPASLLEQ